MFRKCKKCSPCLVGLLQSLGVIIYCALIALLFDYLETTSTVPPKLLGMVLILFLLVFSVAATGLMVFGYPAYLAINKKIKEALMVLGYTFLYSVGIILIILIIISLV